MGAVIFTAAQTEHYVTELSRALIAVAWATSNIFLCGTISLVVACGAGQSVEPPLPLETNNEAFSKPAQQVAVIETVKKTFYCDCPHSGNDIDFESCGYVPINRNGLRTNRVEWEHVVPAEAFGHSFKEWRDGHADCVDPRGKPYKGRRCAMKASPLFREMAADRFNLVQVIGELNAKRSNFSMAMIPGEERHFGTCDIEIANRKIEPRPQIRGDIARIYFYMDSKYPGRGIISKKNKKLFKAWNNQDPIDSQECSRARDLDIDMGCPVSSSY